VGLPTHPI